jgi:outer membrane protein
MKKLHRIFLVARLTVAILCMVAVVPVTPEPRLVLTLDQCIDLAKRNSLGLHIADNALSSAALSQRELLSTRLPQVRLNGNASSAPSFGRFGYDPAVTDHGQIAAQAFAEQKLYDGGVYGLKAKQMQIDLESLGITRRMTERDLVFSVKQAFIEALSAREEIELLRQNISRVTDYLNVVKSLSASGQVHYTDVLKTSIQLSSASAALQKAQEASTLARYGLARVTGVTPDTTFEIDGSLDNIPLVDVDTTAPDSLLPQTLEAKNNDLGIKRSQLDGEIVHREKFPKLALAADAGLLSSLEPPASEHANRLGYSVGISVDVPLLDWAGINLREKQQRLATENVRLQAEIFKRSQLAELRVLTLQIRNLKQRREELQRRTRSAEENYLLTKSKYVGGAAPASEVLAAQQIVIDTRLEELQARADILRLSARLEQILGR